MHIVRSRERTRIETIRVAVMLQHSESSARESGRGLKLYVAAMVTSDDDIVRSRERTRIETTAIR